MQIYCAVRSVLPKIVSQNRCSTEYNSELHQPSLSTNSTTMNLKSLAKSLGVSEATVSRALNGYPEVSERTRVKVLAAAEAAGYRPNPLARSLAVGRTNTIGMIHPYQPNDIGDPMFMEMIAGMATSLEERQMNLIIVPASHENELQAYHRMLKDRRVDGLIVARTRLEDERISYLAKQKFPFVAHGRTSVNEPHAWFDYDNASGMKLAVDYLHQLEHRRIAMISSPLDMSFARRRRDGFFDAMNAVGLEVHQDLLVDDRLDRRSGYAAMQQLLNLPNRPSAVIVDNQMSGTGALRALLDAGISLGKEMSIIVWGRLEDSLAGCDVTTIEQPNPRAAGVKLIEMLLALQNGTPVEELQVLWQPILSKGETVGKRLNAISL